MSNETEAPEVSTAEQWKSASAVGVALTVPSGQTALVKAPGGMQAFIVDGKIPNSLLPIVEQALKSGEAPDMTELKDKVLGEDGDLTVLTEMMDFMDTIILETVLKPELHPVPKDGEGNPLPASQRDANLLYIDDVDMEDRVFIFNYQVGGVKDVERFREQYEANVAALATVKVSSDTPE